MTSDMRCSLVSPSLPGQSKPSQPCNGYFMGYMWTDRGVPTLRAPWEWIGAAEPAQIWGQADNFQTQRKVSCLLPVLIILARLSFCSCFFCTCINHLHPTPTDSGICLYLWAGLVEAGCLLSVEFAEAAAQSCRLVLLFLPSHLCKIQTMVYNVVQGPLTSQASASRFWASGSKKWKYLFED